MSTSSVFSADVPSGATVHETKTPWRRAKTVMRRMLEVIAISHAGAVFCTVVYSVLNPFSGSYSSDGKARARAVVGTASLTAFNIALWGVLTASVLFAFFLRGQYLRLPRVPASQGMLTLAQSVNIVATLTWRRVLLMPLLSAGATWGLCAVGVPVVRYNCHTLIGVMFVATHSVHAISCVACFRRRHTSSVSSVEPTLADVGSGRRVQQPRRPMKNVLCVAVTNVLPLLIAAAAGIQFMGIGKNLDVDDTREVGLFIACGLLFKFLFQMMAKMLAMNASAASSNSRNRLFVITSPILVIEIYLRMVALQLGTGENTKTLTAGTIFVGVFEIAMRFFIVLVDWFVVNRKRKNVERRKREVSIQGPDVIAQSRRPRQIAPTAMRVLPTNHRSRVAAMDAEFEAWKTNHSRVTAAEVMAEMVAEYSGIGFACVYEIMLHNDPAFDLGAGSRTPTQSSEEWLRFVGSQLTVYAVQMAVEVFSDIVGGAFEMYMGIHVDEVFHKDDVGYIRWTIFVLAIHAGGLAISGLVSAGSFDR